MAYDEDLSKDLKNIGKQLERMAKIMEWYKSQSEEGKAGLEQENEVKTDSTGGLEDD